MKISFLSALSLLLLLCVAPSLGGAQVHVPDYSFERWASWDNEAMRFAAGLRSGWNLGNALESYLAADDEYTSADDLETYWGSPETTREMLRTIRSAGYTTLRVPVSWHDHLDENYHVVPSWMDRVQTVVDWAMGMGFYVVLDCHHDIGDGLIYPTGLAWSRSVQLLKAIWTDVAGRFADYDEHLIFQGLNEPRLRGTDYEWAFDPASEDCADAAMYINRLNQQFVDVVRSAGGYNETRYLMISPYANSPYTAAFESFTLPDDTVSDRLIVSLHCYLPNDFAMDQEGTDWFDPEDESQTGIITDALDPVYDRFIMYGIPVVIDEFASTNKDNLQCRVDWTAYFSACAKQRNMPCFYWDNNQFTAEDENYGVFDRGEMTIVYPEIFKAHLTNGQ